MGKMKFINSWGTIFLSIILSSCLVVVTRGLSIPDNFKVEDLLPIIDRIDGEIGEIFSKSEYLSSIDGVIFSYRFLNKSVPPPLDIFEVLSPTEPVALKKYGLSLKFVPLTNQIFVIQNQLAQTFKTFEDLVIANYFTTKLTDHLATIKNVYIRDYKDIRPVSPSKEGAGLHYEDYKGLSQLLRIHERAITVIQGLEGTDTHNMTTDEILRTSKMFVPVNASERFSFVRIILLKEILRRVNSLLFYPSHNSSVSLVKELLIGKNDHSILNDGLTPIHHLLYLDQDNNDTLEIMDSIHEKMGDIFSEVVKKIASCFQEKLATIHLKEKPSAKLRGEVAWETYLRLTQMMSKLMVSAMQLPKAIEIVENTAKQIGVNFECFPDPGKNETWDKEHDRIRKLGYVYKFTLVHLMNARIMGGRDSSTFVATVRQVMSPLQGLLDHQKDSGVWHQLLHQVLHYLSSHHIQQTRAWYNVKDLSDWGMVGKPQGIHITPENFQTFISKLRWNEMGDEEDGPLSTRQMGLPAYLLTPNVQDVVKNVVLTEERLDELNSILKELLGDEPKYECNDNAQEVTITGNIVSISDILKSLKDSCIHPESKTFTKLNIYAQTGIYGDLDITTIPQFREVTLTLIAPFVYWRDFDGSCSTTFSWDTKQITEEFMGKNTFERKIEGSIFTAFCDYGKTVHPLSLEQDVTPRAINRFRMFAREKVKTEHFLNLNLIELLGALSGDERIIELCTPSGLKDELNLLESGEFYTKNCTIEERREYYDELLERANLCVGHRNGTEEIEEIKKSIGEALRNIPEEVEVKGNSTTSSLSDDLYHTSTHHFGFWQWILILAGIGMIAVILFGLAMAYRNGPGIFNRLRERMVVRADFAHQRL